MKRKCIKTTMKIRLSAICLTLLAVIVVVSLACVAVMLSGRSSDTVQGGTIARSDFKKGYELYITEECSGDTYVPNIWSVSDTTMKRYIYEICLTISQYREINAAQDIMLGDVTTLVHLPQIFFDCGSVGYKVEIINWENYTGSEYDFWPIKDEAFGEPIVCVWRIDLKDYSEKTDRINYIKTYSGRDSVNSEGGVGWYSALSPEDFNELLELLYQVNEQCAEFVSQ